jgi:hypothetical protein
MLVFCCDQRIIQFKHPLWCSVSPFGWTLCGTMLFISALQEFDNQHFKTALQGNVCKGMLFWAILSLHFCYLYLYLPLLYSVYWWKSVYFTHNDMNTGAEHLFMKQVAGFESFNQNWGVKNSPSVSVYIHTYIHSLNPQEYHKTMGCGMDSDIVNHFWCFFWCTLCWTTCWYIP